MRGLSSLVRSVTEHKKNSATATLTHARNITTTRKKSCRKGRLLPAKKGSLPLLPKKGSLPLLPKNGSLPQEEEEADKEDEKKTKKKTKEDAEEEQKNKINNTKKITTNSVDRVGFLLEKKLFLPGHPEKSGRNLFLPVLSGQNWKKLDKTGQNCERCQKC